MTDIYRSVFTFTLCAPTDLGVHSQIFADWFPHANLSTDKQFCFFFTQTNLNTRTHTLRYAFANIVTIAPQKEEEAEDEEGDNNVMLETAQLYCRKMVFGRYKQTDRHTQKTPLFAPWWNRKEAACQTKTGR